MMVTLSKPEQGLKNASSLVTADEFLALCETHPNYKDGSFELIHGEIVEKVTTLEHGIIGARLIYFLQSYLMKTNKGYLGVEVTSPNPNNTMNVRKPDISYFFDVSSLNITDSATPYMPDLAIEIISPSQSRREMREKADYYLRNGSKLVWIVYSDTRTVEVCTWTGESLAITTLNDQAILTGGDLLPDFILPISEIFPPKTDTPASE